MNFGDLKSRLTTGILRDDLISSYGSIINEALTEIQRRHSFLAMRQIGQFTILNGNSSVSLATDDDSNPTRFKELTKGMSPVSLKNSDNVLTPCDVWSREKLLRRQARLISNSILYSVFLHPNTARRVQIPVYIDWQGGAATLNVLFAADSDLPFSIQYYGYLPDLSGDSDTNYFTINYPEMVIAKAKSIAFEQINDPIAASFEDLYENRFRYAAAQDAYSATAGMDLRM